MILEQKNHHSFLLFSLILLALVFLCHGLSLQAQFMIDDFSYVHIDQKPTIYKNFADFFLKADAHHYNPLDILLNITLFKTFSTPKCLYGINLVLFYGNCLLLFVLIKTLTKNQHIGMLTAILFAAHPVNAELLSHITLNSVLLSSGFLQGSMLSFWHHLTYQHHKKTYYLLSIFLFICAILFLETALLFPVYLGCLCLLTAAKDRLKTLRLTIPFWGIAIFHFILWGIMTHSENSWSNKIEYLNTTFPGYTATLGFLLKWYVSNLLIPKNFILIKNSAPIVTHINLWNAGLLAAIVLILFLLWQWRKTPKSFALGWFVIGFAFIIPASVVHAYSMGMVIEPHWFYFPTMGYFMLLSIILNDLQKHIKSYLYGALILTLICFWGITSYSHHVIAKTEVGYLEYWLKESPNNLLPSLMLGNLYGYYKNLPIPNELVEQMNTQSEFFIRTVQYNQAIKLLEKLTATQPTNVHHTLWKLTLAALYSKTNSLHKADDQLDNLQLSKLPIKSYLHFAKELERLELREQTIKILDIGLHYYPNNTDLLLFKIATLANQNRFKEAIALLKTNQSQTAKDARFSKLLIEIENIYTQIDEKSEKTLNH